jgi:hypothetical protein
MIEEHSQVYDRRAQPGLSREKNQVSLLARRGL